MRWVRTLLRGLLGSPSNLPLQPVQPLDFVLFVECGEVILANSVRITSMRDSLHNTVLHLRVWEMACNSFDLNRNAATANQHIRANRKSERATNLRWRVSTEPIDVHSGGSCTS